MNKSIFILNNMLTFQFPLYPNKNQQKKLWKHANKCNELYNYFLSQKIEAYKKDKTKIGGYDQIREITKLRKENPEIKEIACQNLQQVPLRLEKSYKDFFRRKLGFPKFRSCKNFFGLTYAIISKHFIQNNIFNTKQYGKIKFYKHREILGKIKQLFITNKNDKWFINITTNYNIEKNINNKIVGIDLGITNLVATSDGEIIKNCTHAKYFDKQINSLKSRRDLRLKKGSRKYKFLSKTIKKLYELKSRKIRDFQHKVSKKLSTKYDTIVLEDLNLKKMSEKNIKGINRELRNSSIGQFVQFLSYKTQKLIFVNPYNTSKTCNHCGYIHKNLTLKDREILCKCGISYNRDMNASKNIFCLGQALLNNNLTNNQSLTIDKILIERKG